MEENKILVDRLLTSISDGIKRTAVGPGSCFRYANDPVGFFQDELGITPWKAQVDVLNLLSENSRVAVPSGHNVGKTFMAAGIVAWFLNSFKDSKIITTAPTAIHLETRLWGAIRRLCMPHMKKFGGRLLNTRWTLAPEWEAIGMSTNEEANFQGAHAENILILFDEAQGIEQNIYDAAETMMGSSNSKWLLIGNTRGASGPFFNRCRNQADWKVRTISCLEHPNVVEDDPTLIPGGVTSKWVDDRRVEWGVGSKMWETRIEGSFPEESEDTLVSLGWLENCAEIDFGDETPLLFGVHIGLDIARYGADETVASVLIDGKLIEQIKWRHASTMASAGRAIDIAKRYGLDEGTSSHIHVDVIGQGAGVVDALEESGWLVDSVDCGSKPINSFPEIISPQTKFKNLRAELYWIVRTLIQQKQLCLPAKFSPLWTELTEHRYTFDSHGRIQIESKDSIRKRIKRSPDHSDSLVLAFSRGKKGTPQISFI